MTKPPITASEIPPDWPTAVREAMPATKLRTGEDNSIEGWSVDRNRWMKIMLPGGATQFATEADRDLVLGAIMGLNILPADTPAK